jgi:hypothetical protein
MEGMQGVPDIQLLVRVIFGLLFVAAIGFVVLIFGRRRRSADIGFLLVVLSLGSCMFLPVFWFIILPGFAGQ